MKIEYKYFQIFIVTILIFSQCSVDKNQEKLFNEFYKDAENKFQDCLDFAFTTYNQYFDLKDCEIFLNKNTKKRFEQNGINSDDRILSATLKATEFDSNILGYSKNIVGHYDKSILDTTIYNIVSKIDTSIVIKKDTLHYSVDIRKTIIYFKCKSKYFEANMDIKIPEDIDITVIETINSHNQERINSLLNTIKTKYN